MKANRMQSSIDKGTQMAIDDKAHGLHSHPHPMLVSSESEIDRQGPHDLGMLSSIVARLVKEKFLVGGACYSALLAKPM